MKYILILLLLTGCGWWKKFVASSTGYAEICIDGVVYIEFATGASVKYLQSGEIETCKK